MKTKTQGKSVVNRSLLYDLLYEKANKLLKQYSPCEIQHGLFSHELFCKYHNSGSYAVCCGTKGGCKYHSTNGCTTKCLSCKLFLCSQFDDTYIKMEFSKLHIIADRYCLTGYFHSKEEILSSIKDE